MILETLAIILGLLLASTAQAQSATEPARLSATERQLCERLLLQTPYASPDAQTMHARLFAKKLVIVGLVTLGVGYVVSVGATLYQVLGRLATGLGPSGTSHSEAQSRRNEQYDEHWTEPLIPIVGPMLFAGHVSDPGYIALGLTSGALQIIGLAFVIYGMWTKPASPCDHSSARLRLDTTGLTLQF